MVQIRKYLKAFVCNGSVLATGLACYFLSRGRNLPFYMEQVSYGLTTVGALAVLAYYLSDDSSDDPATLEELSETRSELLSDQQEEADPVGQPNRFAGMENDVERLLKFTKNWEKRVQEVEVAVGQIREEHIAIGEKTWKERLLPKSRHDNIHDETNLDESARPSTSNEQIKDIVQLLKEPIESPETSKGNSRQKVLEYFSASVNILQEKETSEIREEIDVVVQEATNMNIPNGNQSREPVSFGNFSDVEIAELMNGGKQQSKDDAVSTE